MGFMLQSAAFGDGERLPERFTRAGANVSPPLEWRDVPEGTASFLVTMEDADADGGRYRHWGLRNIDRGRTALPEDVAHDARVPEARGCVNDFDHDRYDGPEPPPGDGPHRYVFTLWALAAADLDASATFRTLDVVEEAKKHVLGRAELRCVCER
jgi:hypothetical protein